jgi:cytochrome P450
MMPFLMLSNLEKHYPQADKFIPERWIKGDPQYNTKTHPFVTMPFGFGPRMCIGRRFAELEIETLVTKVR